MSGCDDYAEVCNYYKRRTPTDSCTTFFSQVDNLQLFKRAYSSSPIDTICILFHKLQHVSIYKFTKYSLYIDEGLVNNLLELHFLQNVNTDTTMLLKFYKIPHFQKLAIYLISKQILYNIYSMKLNVDIYPNMTINFVENLIRFFEKNQLEEILNVMIHLNSQYIAEETESDFSEEKEQQFVELDFKELIIWIFDTFRLYDRVVEHDFNYIRYLRYYDFNVYCDFESRNYKLAEEVNRKRNKETKFIAEAVYDEQDFVVIFVNKMVKIKTNATCILVNFNTNVYYRNEKIDSNTIYIESCCESFQEFFKETLCYTLTAEDIYKIEIGNKYDKYRNEIIETYPVCKVQPFEIPS